MKSSTIFCAALAIVVGAQILYAHTNSQDTLKAEPAEEYLEDNHATPGMFFTTESVVEEYEYDDAYCIVYDDADANMFNVEICVDLETYQMVMEALKTGNHKVGTLVLNDDYATEECPVFTFMDEPEFEMAEASANMRVLSQYPPMELRAAE